MRNGSKACPFCFSKFTFEDFELVDSMPADQPCEGCERLYAILAASARRKAETVSKSPDDAAPLLDDLTPSTILARLLANKRRASEPEPFDARMAATGERD